MWRLYDHAGVATVDLVAVPGEDPLSDGDIEAFHPFLDGVSRVIRRADIARAEALRSEPRDGRDRGLEAARQRALDDVASLDPGVRRLVNPHRYHVSLTRAMKERQRSVIADVRSRV